MNRPVALTVFVLSSIVVGCAARPAAEAPQAPAGYPDSTSPGADDIDGLEAALDRDESGLRSMLSGAGAEPLSAQPDAVPPADAPETPSPESIELEGQSGRCDRACRSLASMRRSADGICRLAGEDHERCERAQTRVQSATDLVQGAGCAC